MLVFSFPIISQVTVIYPLDSWYSRVAFLLSSSSWCAATQRFSQSRRVNMKEKVITINPHPISCLRSTSTSSTIGRVVCCKRSHLPLTIPLSSLSSSKISKRVDFSEMSVIFSVVVGGYEKKKRKGKVGLDLRELGQLDNSQQ